jgi:hypothetical protein
MLYSFTTVLRNCGMTRYFSHGHFQNRGEKRTNLHCFDAGRRIPPDSVKISLAMTASENTPTLAVIDGGGSFARKQWLLFNQPRRLTLDEFEEMARLCGLSQAEEFDLMLVRLRHKARGNIEARYLLAVIEGDRREADRLGRILARRNALGLRVIRTTEKPR